MGIHKSTTERRQEFGIDNLIISKGTVTVAMRRYYLDAARELHYGKETISKLLTATSELQLCNIMHDARKNMV